MRSPQYSTQAPTALWLSLSGTAESPVNTLLSLSLGYTPDSCCPQLLLYPCVESAIELQRRRGDHLSRLQCVWFGLHRVCIADSAMSF